MPQRAGNTTKSLRAPCPVEAMTDTNEGDRDERRAQETLPSATRACLRSTRGKNHRRENRERIRFHKIGIPIVVEAGVEVTEGGKWTKDSIQVVPLKGGS
jgi:hypothetical protein